ncbi:peptidoglycan editing factor PgeF [Rhodohalobacter mucosus]|uniref:Purine nucleoside phosphorylase n=1 Tax=Rhodohalobacter mucosus TaxID=2079485 RepID=A0A316TUN0_9BACT|nr:peptidoglycan editing factor PgeF [Rhodohalobacter mucosus]PWN07568.1 peptidoglycan editing factor PgeF [Rhodohalobacter mucosus]
MITVYHPDIFKDLPGIEAFFTEANRTLVNTHGTVSGLNLGYNTQAEKEEVDRNFEHLFHEIDWEPSHMVLASQVHGSSCKVVNEPGTVDGTDGIITKNEDLALGIRVADCAAILIADPVNRIIGAFHAGWKGAAGGIIPAGMETMTREGGDPDSFYVYISPCISCRNFEVGEEVAEQFPEKFVVKGTYPKPHVDLKGFLISQLNDGGVDLSRIQASDECTLESKRYYSYRRERDRAGRMLAMIKLT